MIRFDVRGRVGLATLDRVERRNALDAEHCDELTSRLADHAQLRAVVITGAGSAFCAGADLAARFTPTDGDAAATDSFRPAFEKLLDAIVDHPAPVVAAINGPAIGAGMQIAVACDLRVAALGARLSIPAGRLGIHLSAANIARLAALVGQGMARDFLLTGRQVTAEEAVECGLVQRVSADALAEALGLAGEVAALAPFTVQGHKRSLNLVAQAQMLADDARGEIRRLEQRAFASEDLQEGLAAFEQKRTPGFEAR